MEQTPSIQKQGSLASQSCTLPYPERFHAAVVFVETLPEDQDLTEETKLLLYSLNQQATVGPCNEPRPWGWNVVNNAKWQSWKQLGDMSSVEAMRLYVRSLEEEVLAWWSPELAATWEQKHKEMASDDSDSSSGSESSSPSSATAAAAATKTSSQQQQPPAAAVAEKQSLPPPSHSQSTPSAAAATSKSRSVAEVVVEGSWVSPYIASESRPPPRYEHAAALVGSQLYVIGGNCGGRYLSDTWALNLENLAWSPVSLGPGKSKAHHHRHTGLPNGGSSGGAVDPAAMLPPVAGHVAVPWNGNVVVIGGHSKLADAPDEMPVRYLDTKTGLWSLLKTSVTGEDSGRGPLPRGGHSGTLISHKVYVFGGEDPRRKLSNEMWTLDLTTLEWSKPSVAGTPPTARSAHTAVSYRNRYILYFGGGSVATCYNELLVFDTQTLAWSEVDVEGNLPPPRAGHASAILGHVMYMVGGGNNNNGCADMWAMDLTGLEHGSVRWSLVGNTPADSAIAAEGLSLLSVTMAGCLVSFGGYNGRYHNALHVYRPEGYVVVKAPRSGTTGSSGVFPSPSSAFAGGGGGDSGTASAATAAPGGGSSSDNNNTISSSEYAKVKGDLEVARKEAAAAKETVQHEVAIMRRQLDAANAARTEAESVVEGLKAELDAERAKAMQLEVEAAELRQQLSDMGELERELNKYRQREEDAGQKKSGLWGYISGSDVAKA